MQDRAAGEASAKLRMYFKFRELNSSTPGYDNLNRLISGSSPVGPYSRGVSSSWTYDTFGNRLSEINPLANTSATYTSARSGGPRVRGE